jgi:quercetin dioxygenase-like cupin family protein
MARSHSPEMSGVDEQVVGPGQGETLGSDERRSVHAKLERDELAVTESVYASGESGPGRHLHKEHIDCFFVLEGELTFEIGDRELRVPAGGFVAVPPTIVHTFRNDGVGAARFLNMHAPSKGFIQHLRLMRDARSDEDRRRASERFDTFDLPA